MINQDIAYENNLSSPVVKKVNNYINKINKIAQRPLPFLPVQESEIHMDVKVNNFMK